MSDSQQARAWLNQVAQILETLPRDLEAKWLLEGLRSAAIEPIANDIADFAREKPGLIPHQLLAAVPLSSTTSFFVHLLRLEAITRLIPGCPSWASVLVSDAALTAGEPLVVESSVLHSPREYAHQFDTMLTRGFPWINMCAAGVLRDALLVEIEHAPIGHRGKSTAVNLSGPANAVIVRPRWSLEHLITIQH